MFNDYCLLIKKDMCEGKCVEILAELGEAKKEEHILAIKESEKLTYDEMRAICKRCPNYPF